LAMAMRSGPSHPPCAPAPNYDFDCGFDYGFDCDFDRDGDGTFWCSLRAA
jgi:hypothetical protein